jgi:threonine dehydrogenase-like Zn-dependent dehydrogenase
MKTRRAFLVAPGEFEIREIDLKRPSPSQVLVKIAACGLCNWEQNHWKGLLGTCPQTLGHEWGGVVQEAGKRVKNVKPGDSVAALPDVMTGFSDYVVAEARTVRTLAKGIRPDQSLGEPLTCVVNVLHAANPQAGDYGVVVGCGPMGLWCIQALAGHMLAGLIAVDVAPKKLQLAKRFGATHTISPAREDVVERLEAITAGWLADFVIEGTGIPGVLNQAVTYLKNKRGRLAVMSAHEGAGPAFDWRPIQRKAITLIGAHPGFSTDIHDDFRRAVDLLNNGVFRMDGIISHRFKLSRIEEAFATLENKPKDYIKGVVVP